MRLIGHLILLPYRVMLSVMVVFLGVLPAWGALRLVLSFLFRGCACD